MSDTEEIDSTTDDSPELPDGLVSVVAAGFDALKWEFVDDNIFKISYGKHKKVTLRRDNADKKYDVPDGVTVKKSSKQVLAEITTFKGVHSIHQEDFSTSIKTSLGVDGISASTSFSLAKSSRIETDDQKTTTFKSCYVLVYIFTRNSTKKLSNGFKSDLKGLPTSYEPGNSGNKDKFIKLFQKWGTHYLSKGFFGGSFVVRLVMDARAFEKFSSSEIKTAVDTSYEGVVNSSTSVEVENKTIDSFKSEDRSTRIEVYGVGGTKSVQQYDDWIASVADSVMFLDDALAVSTTQITPIFTPIWQLADDDDDTPGRQAALQQAWKAYLPPEKQQDDGLPGTIPGQLNVNFLADKDGFLSALASTDNHGDGGEIYARTDRNADPKRQTASASVHQYGEQINKASLFTPVRAKEYYTVDYKSRWGTVAVASGMRFQPFPLDFGEWEQLSFGLHYPGRKLDGFVVAWITYNQDSNRGFVIGSQVVKGQLRPYAGSSVHWYGHNDRHVATGGFCMPVVRGAAFQIDLTITSGSIGGAVFWLPMGSSHRMLEPVDYARDKGNQAGTHGILTGFLSQENNPGLVIGASTLTLQTAAAQDFTNPTVLGQATVQYSRERDLWIQYNSATAVVTKGSWFRALVGSASFASASNATIRWVGIDRA